MSKTPKDDLETYNKQREQVYNENVGTPLKTHWDKPEDNSPGDYGWRDSFDEQGNTREDENGNPIQEFHAGWDLVADTEEIYPILSGHVAGYNARDMYLFGYSTIIETTYNELSPTFRENIGLTEGQSVYVLYAHMAEIPQVTAGQTVWSTVSGRNSTQLGEMGSTGHSTGTHLHLEIRVGTSGLYFGGIGFLHTDYETPYQFQIENQETWFNRNPDIPMNSVDPGLLFD